MGNLFTKGTVIGFDYKKWEEDVEVYSSLLLSVIETWIIKTYNFQDNSQAEHTGDIYREYGRIKSAYYALEGDLHNLFVNHHLLKSILTNNDLDRGLKSLYLSLLVENYLINIRSIYDFTSYFPRIIMPLKDIQQYRKCNNPDSLNTFISYCENNKLRCFRPDLVKLMQDTKEELDDIRSIRDSIIHKGKESIVYITDNEVFFRIPAKAPFGIENLLPDILNLGNLNYPLFEYLRELTLRLLIYMEKLGTIFISEFQKDETYKVELTALVGICVKDFNKFIHN